VTGTHLSQNYILHIIYKSIY
jgi:hypothetical protein